MHTFIWYCFGVIILVGLSNTYYNLKIQKIVREKHPRIWKELGEPTIWRQNAIGIYFRFVRFTFQQTSVMRKDHTLNAACQPFRIGQIIMWSVFLLLIVLSVFHPEFRHEIFLILK